MVVFGHAVEARKDPAVQRASLLHGNGLGLRVKPVKGSVIGVELVDVPRGEEHLGVGFTHAVGVEFHRVPRRTGGDHVPASGVGTLSVEVVPRVNNVASRFGHFLAFSVENQAEGEAPLVGHVVKHGGRNGQQRVEPSPCLVHTFADVVHREGGVEPLLFVKGMVPLSEGCTTGIKPAIHDKGFPLHRLTGVRNEGEAVHDRAVEVDIVGAFGVLKSGGVGLGHLFLELLNRANALHFAGFASPDG